MTFGDIKKIEKILEERKETADEATKSEIDELINKLDDLEIRSELKQV